MLPNELEDESLTLPETDKHTIVIVTGKELRHQRFAHRILNAFPDQVLAWYELDSNVDPIYSVSEQTTESIQKVETSPRSSKAQKTLHILTKELPQRFRKYGLWATLKKIYSLGTDAYYKLFFLRGGAKKMAEAEEKLFAREVDTLKNTSKLKPIKIHPNDVHSNE
ncbi:MAG: hypothetical protein KAI17_22250, partial [Thiotrichaceae bacterium]|nr:hypothetical protein [Thiotrichaceae bacterium]